MDDVTTQAPAPMSLEQALVQALIEVREDVSMSSEERLATIREFRWWYRRAKLEEQG